MVAVPFAIDLATILLFMPIFSGMRNVPLAAADIVIVWATIIWCVVAVWPDYRWAALVQWPHFYVGIDCHGAANIDHGYELASKMIRVASCRPKQPGSAAHGKA